ncbi:hypothetical protein [Kocuria sp.]|uniref:hypothetical protein n=1 Tax=Kocuria sp. TaxID=1871328 RepID=UPI0026DAEAE8|nr:hypothetical protein [Kocuria sp.]MDO4918422.1 hypothetical protein [Kocuria sp.]
MSTPPENTPGRDAPGPWSTHPATGENERLAPPAPMIELDTPQQSEPVKPLGPRRLARLQREMAEHTQRIQESESRSGRGEVDQALLATQHRLAELAVRAAAANEQDRQDAERAVAAQPAPSGPAADDAAGPASAERVTVTLPPAKHTAAGGLDLPVSGADPASLPASAVHYGPVTETSMIPIQAPQRTQDAAETGPELPVDAAADSNAAVDTPGDSATEFSTPAGRSTPTERPATPSELPAEPVRAVDAEGLRLLEPKAYTRAGAPTRIVLAVLLAAVVALAVALIVFIL